MMTTNRIYEIDIAFENASSVIRNSRRRIGRVLFDRNTLEFDGSDLNK